MDILIGLGGLFSLAMDSQAFSGELVWLAPFLGEGNNLESILLISPVADLYLSFRMQECRCSPCHGGMGYSPALCLQTQQHQRGKPDAKLQEEVKVGKALFQKQVDSRFTLQCYPSPAV
jgi:hypothetical protein